MNTDKSFSLKSIIPVWYEYIYLLLIGGVSSGVFVWLFLWILDGDEWHIIGTTLLPNLILLFILGSFISHFYFKAEFKRFRESDITFDLEEIKVKKDHHDIRIYKKPMLLRVRLDSQFYFLLGYRKITLVFSPIRGRKNQIESILVKKKDSKNMLDQMEAYRINK